MQAFRQGGAQAQRKPRRRGGRSRLPLLAAILLGADLLAVGLYLGWAGMSLPPSIPATAHPIGVVFFDGFGAREGLGPVSLARVEHAAALARTGLVERLVCVGGSRPQRPEPGAALMAAALARRGVPPARIRHDTTSFDTRTNWQSALALMPAGAAQQALLISSPLHLLRIRHITAGAGTPAPTASIGAELRRRRPAIWLDVHREWLAWTAMTLLPTDLHRRWIGRWRALWDNLALEREAAKASRSA